MGIFNFFRKKGDNNDAVCDNKRESKVVWRDENGTIRCLGDDCPKCCDETCPIYLNTQAMKLIMMGNGALAIPIYENAIKIAPDFYDGWNNLASLYAQSSNYEKAYECYLKAHECNPEKHQPLFGLALATRDLNRYEECIEWCEKYEGVIGDNRTDKIRQTAEKALRNNGSSFDSEDINEKKRATAIVMSYLEDERTQEIANYRGGFPHIPEIMIQAPLVCKEVFEGLTEEEDDTYMLLLCSLIWCAYAGMGAVALWNNDWEKFNEKGIVDSLIEERGFFAMDEYVTDYIGVGWDSDESNNIRVILRDFANEALEKISENTDNYDLDDYMECLKAMFLYGMVIEMSRLGMH